MRFLPPKTHTTHTRKPRLRRGFLVVPAEKGQKYPLDRDRFKWYSNPREKAATRKSSRVPDQREGTGGGSPCEGTAKAPWSRGEEMPRRPSPLRTWRAGFARIQVGPRTETVRPEPKMAQGAFCFEPLRYRERRRDYHEPQRQDHGQDREPVQGPGRRRSRCRRR